MRYAFLVLALLLAVPGALAYLLRPDLRPSIRFGVALSLPFALTEPFFLGEYWRPAFLFDLGEQLGFGVEDFLFVAALAAVSVASYPIAARRTLAPLPRARRGPAAIGARAGALLAAVGAATTALYAAGLSMIHAAPIAMIAGTALAWSTRPDLVTPALGGGLATMIVYQSACLILAATHPQVFHTVWRTEESISILVLGIPVEELVYGAASGFAASIFVPWARGERLVPSPLHEPGTGRAARARSR